MPIVLRKFRIQLNPIGPVIGAYGLMIDPDALYISRQDWRNETVIQAYRMTRFAFRRVWMPTVAIPGPCLGNCPAVEKAVHMGHAIVAGVR